MSADILCTPDNATCVAAAHKLAVELRKLCDGDPVVRAGFVQGLKERGAEAKTALDTFFQLCPNGRTS